MNIQELGSVIAIVFIVIFIVTAFMTILSVTGTINISPAHRNVLFGKLLLEVIAAIFFLFYRAFTDTAYFGMLAGLGPGVQFFAKDVFHSRYENSDIVWMSRKDELVLNIITDQTSPIEGRCRVQIDLNTARCNHYFPEEVLLHFNGTKREVNLVCGGQNKIKIPCYDPNAPVVTQLHGRAGGILDLLVGSAFAQTPAAESLSSEQVSHYAGLLGSPDPQLRYFAMDKLTELGPQSLPVLEKSLLENDSTARLNAIASLRTARWKPLNDLSTEAFGVVVKSLLSEEEPIRRESVKLFEAYIKDDRHELLRSDLAMDQVLAALDESLKAENRKNSRSAELLIKTAAFSEQPSPRLYSLLGTALKHEVANVREESLQALAQGKQGSEELLPEIVTILESEKSSDILEDAIAAVSAIGKCTPRLTTALKELSRSGHPKAKAAGQALERLACVP